MSKGCLSIVIFIMRITCRFQFSNGSWFFFLKKSISSATKFILSVKSITRNKLFTYILSVNFYTYHFEISCSSTFSSLINVFISHKTTLTILMQIHLYLTWWITFTIVCSRICIPTHICGVLKCVVDHYMNCLKMCSFSSCSLMVI